MSARARNSYARRSSDIAERLRVPEHAELGDVAAEEERGRPVGDDAQLPREERELVQVVRAGDEPAGEAAQPHAEHVGDPLVAAKRRHLAEHAVAVRAGLAAAEVPGQAPRLAERVLAGRRGGLPGGGRVRNARAVAEGPDPLEPLHAQRAVDDDAAALVEREAKLGEVRVRTDAGRPDERARADPVAVGEEGVVRADFVEGRPDADVDAAAGELLRRVVPEPPRDLRKDLRRGV